MNVQDVETAADELDVGRDELCRAAGVILPVLRRAHNAGPRWVRWLWIGAGKLLRVLEEVEERACRS